MARRRVTTPGPYLLQLDVLRDRIPAEGGYPYDLPVVRNLDQLDFHPKVTFLVGENGTGKSTLMEAIAVLSGLNAEGGSRNFRFATRESHSPLHDCLRLARAPSIMGDSYFLRAETYYNVATEIERLDQGPGGGLVIDSHGGRPLHEQSHGEAFLALFRHRFRKHGLYLLDEPEAALSPSRQLEMLALLHEACRGGCQFVVATHSPILMAYPDALIYALSAQAVQPVAYDDVEHVRVARGFLANPRRTLDVLLAEDDQADEARGDD